MRARMRGRAGVTLEATEEEVGKLKLALTKYSGFPKVYQETRRCLCQAFTLIPMAIKCVCMFILMDVVVERELMSQSTHFR